MRTRNSNNETLYLARMRRRQLAKLSCMFGTLSQIKQIEPKLHFVRLSGKKYGYHDLEKAIGPMKRLKKPLKRMPLYQTQTICHFRGFRITAFTGPIQGYLPKCRLEFALPEKPPRSVEQEMEQSRYQKQCLQGLNQLLPGLGVSKVEYAIDFYPSGGAHEVRTLFKLVRRYLFVPYVRDIRLLGGQEESGSLEIGGRMTMSQVLRAGALKFYERGCDGQRDNDTRGWDYEHIDRLRLEFTASRDDLVDMGLCDLDDFLRDPKFRNVFRNRLQFLKAKKTSRNLPSQSDSYDSIQEEFWAVRDASGRCFYQERETEKRFDELLAAINGMTIWFDRRWIGHHVQRPVWFVGNIRLI